MHLSLLLLSVAILLTSACSSNPSPTPEKKQPIVIKEDFSIILEDNFRGQFSIENGQAYFKNCATNRRYSVNTKAGVRDIYQQITAKKTSPVYIEFTGEIEFSNSKNKKTDVQMRIDRVHHMALAKASLQCAKAINTFRFKAQGEQPYWRLTSNSQKLFFATKASNQVYQVSDANFQTTQNNNIKADNEDGQRLNLIIQPGHCYNSKNKEYWGYTAKVETVWGEFKGCGEPGWPVIEENFSGYYLNETLSTISNLTLNKDFSVKYHEKIGNKNTLKTGFWKSNSPDQVVVMLTRQENKKIRQEIIFKRHGLTLSSMKINKNNIVTQFNDDALIFKKMNQQNTPNNAKQQYIGRKFTAQHIQPEAKVDVEIQKKLNQYFKIHRTDPKNTKFNSVKYDLNGDGIEDAIVLLDWCSKNGCEMLIFEGQESGYRFSSRVSRVHAPITIAQTQHYLWQSLLIEKDKEWFKLDFDGISYPIHTRDLKKVDKQDHATDVILFSQGTPRNWFPIKI